jgi:multidrug efflux pump subunit AcrB
LIIKQSKLIRFLIHRPIAVLMTFSVLLVFGIWAMVHIPVSLLPAIDVPQIVVKVNYPNTPAPSIEENIVRPIRENLATLHNLKDIESISTNHAGTLYLTFDYGTRMDLAFIEVNEQLDRVTNTLPRDLFRPQVVRINTADVPIARLQVIPKKQDDYLQVSALAEKVIKKRIEQIEGVSLVDINGKKSGIIEVTPLTEKLTAAGIHEQDLMTAIQQSNRELGSLSVKDGHYRYFVRLANRLEEVADIEQLPVPLQNGTVMRLKELALIKQEAEVPTGVHLFNGQPGLVISIHKQSQARMHELIHHIREAVSQFETDYPEVEFELTQDQSFVLEAGVSNLYQALMFGGVCCIILLFLLLGHYASPLLMSISIPASLIITFIFFYLFGISFNIISLSGLALGIGMLIDNSIVVLDRITRKRRSGLSMDDSCVVGVQEVVSPVVSTVLTSVAVYAPLVYLSGLAGALVFDQAIALTLSLGVSLLIAFFLNPVLYKLFLRQDPDKLKEDTRFYTWLTKRYHTMIEMVFRRKRLYFGVTLFMMTFGIFLASKLPVSSLPAVEETESLVIIDWNEPVQVKENERRVQQLMHEVGGQLSAWEADIGLKQFLLNRESNTVQRAEVYFRAASASEKKVTDKVVDEWLGNHFPNATRIIQNAPNAFTQLFEDKTPFLEARFKQLQGNGEEAFESLESMLATFSQAEWRKGLGLVQEENIELVIDNDKLALYNIPHLDVRNQLNRSFGNYTISEIKRFGEVRAIKLHSEKDGLQNKLQTRVVSATGTSYPLNAFVTWSHQRDARYVTADKTGMYKSFSLPHEGHDNVEGIILLVKQAASNQGLSVEFSGRYFNSRKLLYDMLIIFAISSLLLYFVLAVEFENLVHPFLVMLTMPLGVAGALLALHLSGSTLNIMSAVGLIVVLGIIVDDPILKIETLNRLRKQYGTGAYNGETLMKAIHEAGEICLKPVLLTSLTTCMALLPILFMPGIGAELQKPLVYVVLGGLTIGTFFSLWFTPLAYWFLTRKT